MAAAHPRGVREKLGAMSDFISRGFKRRRRAPDDVSDRLPPGQYYETGFPVLTAGPTPRVATEDWGMRVDGMVGSEREWTWDEFHELPYEDVPSDIHCVTKWSKLGTTFRGVSVDVLLGGADPQGQYAMAYSYGGQPTHRPPPRLPSR